jgi:NAD(P)-dependent dehydrogenase (short-subunit alcohol dehydrogenase family)
MRGAWRDGGSAGRRAFGGLDILVNNAQEVPNGKLDDVSDEAFIAGFESGPLASFRLMKLARPLTGGARRRRDRQPCLIRRDPLGHDRLRRLRRGQAGDPRADPRGGGGMGAARASAC